MHGVVGDFGRDLGRVPDGDRRLFAFLGGTIGNLYPPSGRRSWRALRELMGPGDRLLIGTDLVKDRGVLEAAYNDSAGVTAEFNRNVLRVVNAGLDADFDPEAFEHVAFFDEANSWIEMRLRANGAQQVRIEGADLEVTFADGEEIRTEISAKFTREARRARAGRGRTAPRRVLHRRVEAVRAGVRAARLVQQGAGADVHGRGGHRAGLVGGDERRDVGDVLQAGGAAQQRGRLDALLDPLATLEVGRDRLRHAAGPQRDGSDPRSPSSLAS